MFQDIEGHHCYVVELATFPPPLPIHDGGDPSLTLYAEAMNAAIESGQIREPGKYGIELYRQPMPYGNVLKYNVYEIKE